VFEVLVGMSKLTQIRQQMGSSWMRWFLSPYLGCRNSCAWLYSFSFFQKNYFLFSHVLSVTDSL